MLLEFEAIRGQRSAHSLATGPVTVDPTCRINYDTPRLMVAFIISPFISPLLFTITPALSVY